MACFHVKPRRLLTAAAILNTSDVNQKALTAFSSGVPWLSKVYCNVVAVTAEKNVATVDKFRRLAAPCSCTNRMVGTPARMGWLWRKRESGKGPEHTDFDEYREGIGDRFYVFADF